MPSTFYTDPTLGAFAVGARTSAAGTAVADVSAEEARLVNQIFTPGVVKPVAGWKVSQRGAGANMSVDVGSGSAKTDLAVVEGQIAGQGNYLVRLGAVTNVSVPAADLTQARTDQVYLVVADAPYDGGSLALPRLSLRQGDPGAGAPGPDSSWDAYLLLASIVVGAGVTSITTANITDRRVFAALLGSLVSLSGQTVTYTSSGTFVKANYPGLRAVKVKVQGGGGGGGGAVATGESQGSFGNGGAGGGYCEKLILVDDLATSVTVTRGAGGAGVSGAAGNAGGNSSFGAHCSANGGGAGASSNAGSTASVGTAGTGGGSASGGDLNISGGHAGGGARTLNGLDITFGGQGGGSMLGFGPGIRSSNNNGYGATGYGAGGGGASNTASQGARTGGAGGIGIVIVELVF